MLGMDLKGKKLGIVGAGRIGQRVAEIAHHGLGMEICYSDVSKVPALEEKVNAHYSESLEELLKEADVVSIHVPLIEQTKHLINAEKLALMKSSATLINTARGPIVEEQALVNALKNAVIRNAGIDVFEFEPEFSEELKNMDNVVLTPHIASATEETRSKMSEIVADNLIDFFSGKEPRNKVQS